MCKYTPTERRPITVIPSPASKAKGTAGEPPSSSDSQQSASEQSSPQTISRGAARSFPLEHGNASHVVPAADRVHSLTLVGLALFTKALALSRLVLSPTMHLPHSTHSTHPYSAQPLQPSLVEHRRLEGSALGCPLGKSVGGDEGLGEAVAPVGPPLGP